MKLGRESRELFPKFKLSATLASAGPLAGV
jgi:hypothetical protein